MSYRWRLLCLLTMLCLHDAALGQPKGPQPWWPVQPTPLPFVHALFTDDMVLQRDIQTPLWGWSVPGDTVVVFIDGKPSGKAAVAGQDGKWLTRIAPMPAGPSASPSRDWPRGR